MFHTLPAISINGIVDKQVSPLDRGFTYGDGVFETCLILNSQIPLWDLHRERLMISCKKLLIPLQIETVEQYLAQLMTLVNSRYLEEATVKLIVTRGQGGRGYRLPKLVNTTICIAIFPKPSYPTLYYSEGVSVRLCTHRLSCNTALAGLKHLNRLEHILARAEWNDESIAEGLLVDINDNLIEATISNIFIVKGNELLTPDLTEAGVAGVMRRFIIETLAPRLNLISQVKKIPLHNLFDAEEIFLCNSVFGIWPIINIANLHCNQLEVGKLTRALQKSLTAKLTGVG